MIHAINNSNFLNISKYINPHNKGSALIIVHPLFTQSVPTDLDLERRDPILFSQILLNDYDSYKNNLELCIKSTTWPVIVLAGERSYDNTIDWLKSLQLKKMFSFFPPAPGIPPPNWILETIAPRGKYLPIFLKLRGYPGPLLRVNCLSLKAGKALAAFSPR